MIDLAYSFNKLEKGKNLHRFRSISDRISLVNINLKSKTSSLALKGEATHFGNKLDFFYQTDLSESFTSLYKTLFPLSASLPQIVVNQKHLVSALLETIKSNPDFKPPYELISSLAEDLCTDFEHYDSVFETLLALCDSSTPERLEAIFCVICYIFKFAEKRLVANFQKLFFSSLSSCFLLSEATHPNIRFREHVFSH